MVILIAKSPTFFQYLLMQNAVLCGKARLVHAEMHNGESVSAVLESNNLVALNFELTSCPHNKYNLTSNLVLECIIVYIGNNLIIK